MNSVGDIIVTKAASKRAVVQRNLTGVIAIVSIPESCSISPRFKSFHIDNV